MKFTVIDLIREQGFEPASPLSWEIGAAVRDAYERAHGALPEKDLRPKTSGTGSHCFACYPPSFKAEAGAIVARLLEAAHAAARAQPRLDF